MSNKRANISQIRKYLNGELDAAAMHQLERSAQNDPFLFDAMEGYEIRGINQRHLADLDNRLHDRVNKNGISLFSRNIIAAAAVLLAVLTIGGFWLFNSTKNSNIKPSGSVFIVAAPSKKRAIDTNVLKADTAVPHIYQLRTVAVKPLKRQSQAQTTKPATSTNTIANVVSPLKMDTTAIAKTEQRQERYSKMEKDTVPVNEVVVSGYEAKKKKEVSGNITQLKSDLNVEAQPDRAIQNQQALGLSVLKEVRIMPVPPRNITGTVVDKTDGQPIIGAYVRVEGRNSGTVTDVKGHFALSQVTDKETLAVAFIGYNSRKVPVSHNDSISVSLTPTQSASNEVVVIGNGTGEKTEAMPAHPQQNWDSFKKYLKEKAASPDGKTGTVKLSFTVGSDGELRNFKVIRGLSDKTDQKAIELIKNGPEWVGNTSGKPEEVKVRVVFK